MFTSTIVLTEASIKFTPKERGVREFGIHTSFSNQNSAQGPFRMESVNNGRYGKKHPIVNKSGDVVGAIKDGFSSVGYTWCFVYSELAGAFAISHAYYRSDKGCLSFLEPDGRFGLFDDTPKFIPKDTIFFERKSWITLNEGFMLLGNGERLVIISALGLATVDMRSRTLIGKLEFENYGNDNAYDLSPLVDNIAVAMCCYEGDDPVTGESRYGNYLRIYDAYRCSQLAQVKLKVQEPCSWQVRFSHCGRFVQLTSKEKQIIYRMT